MKDAFDKLAPYYQSYAARRANYIRSVDRIVIENAPIPRSSLLDIGSGDGIRGIRISKQLGIRIVVAVDSSKEMIRLCKNLPFTQVWHTKAENLDHYKGDHFDIIICLWNVLGHIESPIARIQAFINMRLLLRTGGRIIIDINNRYNLAEYGVLKVLYNLIRDSIYKTNRSGDVEYIQKIQGNKINAKGHLFSPIEIETLIKKSGLRVEQKYVVDYDTGKRKLLNIFGQLVYVLVRS